MAIIRLDGPGKMNVLGDEIMTEAQEMWDKVGLPGHGVCTSRAMHQCYSPCFKTLVCFEPAKLFFFR